MVLYNIYVEPFLLRMSDVVAGFALCAPVIGLPLRNEEVAREKLESYVDDSETIISSDSEFLLIEKLVRRFKDISGPILNRDKKTKVLGLGRWKGREDWPLPWLTSVSQLKILGFIFHPDYNEMLQLN